MPGGKENNLFFEYANEELIDRYGNAFQEDFQPPFLSDIRNAVDMIHGSAEIEKRPGNAGASYTADSPPWAIGWILGIEWTADFFNGTNAAAPDRTSFSGRYQRRLPSGRILSGEDHLYLHATFGCRKNKSSWGTIKRRGFVSGESDKKT